jgi:hypothetical protein
MSQNLDRIAELAREDPGRRFHSIAHFLTPKALYEACFSLRKDASAGVDGLTHAEYARAAHENIRKLHERLKSKTYRAQPLRRIYIPKEDGTQRAISIPALEDKIVQRATADLLSAIFEQDFRAPCKGTVIQWVQIPPGNCRFSRKQPKQPHKERWLEPLVERVALGDSATMQAVM